MKTKIKYPISIDQAQEIVNEGIFNLHPPTVIKEVLKFLGWSYTKYSRLLGRPSSYINSRFNNGYSKRFTYEDVIVLKTVIQRILPKQNFNEFLVDVLVSKGRLGLSPVGLVRLHEKEVKELIETINQLRQELLSLKRNQP